MLVFFFLIIIYSSDSVRIILLYYYHGHCVYDPLPPPSPPRVRECFELIRPFVFFEYSSSFIYTRPSSPDLARGVFTGQYSNGSFGRDGARLPPVTDNVMLIAKDGTQHVADTGGVASLRVVTYTRAGAYVLTKNIRRTTSRSSYARIFDVGFS